MSRSSIRATSVPETSKDDFLREEVAAAVKAEEKYQALGLQEKYLQLVEENDDVNKNLNSKSDEVLIIKPAITIILGNNCNQSGCN